MNEFILSIQDVSKSFGGLFALREVSLNSRLGEVHAVIGPNGAGKTTLLNIIAGELAADAGRIIFDGEEILGLRPHRIAQKGIGRCYQRTNIFPPLTALDNCRLAAQSKLAHSMRFFRSADRYPTIDEAAESALSEAGLSDRAQRIAANLSHGEQRQLEVGMALATRPRLLLLDEPLAGMGPEESDRMVGLLRSLAVDRAILLIEHDMDAVFALADTLTVMANGMVLAAGDPDSIRSNPQVQAVYLGHAGEIDG